MRKILFFCFLLFSSLLFANLVSDVQCKVDENKIIITYYLSETSDVVIKISTDGGKIFKKIDKVIGDVGDCVTPGYKQVIWYVLDEYDKLIGNINFKVIAKKIKLNHNEYSYNASITRNGANVFNKFYQQNGLWSIEWYKLSAEVGNCWGLESGILSLRYSILELEWLNFSLFSVLVDSKSLGKWFDDEYKFYYDPVLRLHMPCSKKWTIFSAIAPSFHFATGVYGESFYYESIDKVSFKTDLGVRYYDDFFFQHFSRFVFEI